MKVQVGYTRLVLCLIALSLLPFSSLALPHNNAALQHRADSNSTMAKFTGHLVNLRGQDTFYYEAGPSDGELVIFIHGWPDLAQSWHHQLRYFLHAGYRVVAPDMRGYGQSSAPTDRRAYSLEVLSAELLDLLRHYLNSERAIWIGHDWGSALVSSFASHYPEATKGVVLLAVPYRSVDLGLGYELTTVNRDIYPEAEYPYGQFEYQVAYERDWVNTSIALETQPEKTVKVLGVPMDPAMYGQPGPTSDTFRKGGFFGDPNLLPDIPLNATFLDQALFDVLVASRKKYGAFPPSAWYLNQDVNTEWATQVKNGGVLEFPVLFIDARFDALDSLTTAPKLGAEQRRTCKDLTEVYVQAGHWVHLEKPKEVNEALDVWLAGKFAPT